MSNKYIYGYTGLRRLQISSLPDLSDVILEGTLDVAVNPDLKSLKGFPRIIRGDFEGQGCGLESLDGFTEVTGNIDLQFNKLTSLRGFTQKKIRGYLGLAENMLKTLKGCPEEIVDTLFIQHNPIETLDGFPKKCGRIFVDASFPFSYEEVAAVCKIERKNFTRLKA